MTKTRKTLATVAALAIMAVGCQDSDTAAEVTTTEAPVTTTTEAPTTTTTLPPTTTTTVAPTTTTTAAPVEIAPEDQGPEAAFVYNVKEFMVGQGFLEVFDFENDSIVEMGKVMCDMVDEYISDDFSPDAAMANLLVAASETDEPEFSMSMYLVLLRGAEPVFCPANEDYVDEMWEFAESL